MTTRLKLRHVGLLIAVVAIGFLAARLADGFSRIPPLAMSWPTLGHLLCAVLAYGTAALPAAGAWSVLVGGRMPEMGFRRCVQITCVSQMGKYLPGNVGQHIAKVALSSAVGAPLVLVTGAQIVETFAAIPATALAALIASMLSLAPLPATSALPMQLILCGSLVLYLVFARSPQILARRWARLDALKGLSLRPWPVTRVILLLSACMAFSGISLACVQHLAAPDAPFDTAGLAARYAVAWLAGYAVVGAPAGLGVRDGVLVALLTPAMPAEQAILLALLHRLVTLAGDALLFTFGALMQGRGAPTR